MKPRIISTALVITIILAIFTQSVNADQTNYINNGGFEQALPKLWIVGSFSGNSDNRDGTMFTFTTLTAHSGTHSLKMYINNFGGGYCSYGNQYRDGYADGFFMYATAGKKYTVAAYTKGTSTGTSVMMLSALGSSKNELLRRTMTLNTSADWTLSTIDIDTPAGTTYLALSIVCYGNCDYYFDDIACVEGAYNPVSNYNYTVRIYDNATQQPINGISYSLNGTTTTTGTINQANTFTLICNQNYTLSLSNPSYYTKNTTINYAAQGNYTQNIYMYPKSGDPIFLTADKTNAAPFDNVHAVLTIADQATAYDGLVWFKDGLVYENFRKGASSWQMWIPSNQNQWIDVPEYTAMNQDYSFNSTGQHTITARLYSGTTKIFDGTKTVQVGSNDQQAQISIVAADAITSAILNGATVTVTDQTANTSATYTVNGILSIPGTRYHVYAFSGTLAGYLPYSTAYQVTGDMPVYLYFQPAGEPANTSYTYSNFIVTDSTTGAYINGALIMLNTGDSRGTGTNGYARFSVLKSTAYTYTVSANGYMATQGTFNLAANGTAKIQLVPKSIIPTIQPPTTTATPGYPTFRATLTPQQQQENIGGAKNDIVAFIRLLVDLALFVSVSALLAMFVKNTRAMGGRK